MRFDDRLETALRQADDNDFSIAAKWQQLVDILAQNPTGFDVEFVAAGLQKVRELFPLVSAQRREETVRALAGRIQSPPLVLLLASDIPPVAASAIAGAQLDDRQWADIVPQMPTRARGFLRNRSDLGPETRRVLSFWAAADFVLPPAKSVQSGEITPAGGTQIRDIVERIERLRQQRETREAPYLPFESEQFQDFPKYINEIRFETDDNGTVSRIEGAPPGAVVGVDIAEPAYDDGPGPDAYGAAAFRQRMPIENARMRLCGAPIIAGDWRINATPVFNQSSGRFNGYRGIFRRPTLVESASIAADTAHEADHIQQLVHELRTPLGAIIGFSEIIEQQLFGPVTEDYRSLARNILNDAERLLAGFDDLSMAAKIEEGSFSAEPGTTQWDWLSARLIERLRSLTDLIQVRLVLEAVDPVPPFAIDNELAERLFSRLLSAVIIGCEEGETLDGQIRANAGPHALNRFMLRLPRKLTELDEAALFGSGPQAFDDPGGAPLLGLGFSLRLVRSLARNVGGDLHFYNEALILSLPAVANGCQECRDNERE